MLFRSSGNYAYTCTRVKAKKPFLLKREQYTKLLLMKIPQISRFMGETQYKKEIDELARKYSGVDLVEMATYVNLSRTYKQILDFSKGELKEMIAKYLRRSDVWNIKTIMRGKFYGASNEDILEDIIPAGVFKIKFLEKLINLGSVDGIIEALKGTEYYHPLKKVRDEIEEITTLMPFENEMDRSYYTFLIEEIKPDTKANTIFLDFIRKEIDTENLKTLFKLKYAGIEKDKIINFLIKGGQELKEREFEQLALTESFEQFTSELEPFSFYEEIRDAIENIKSTESLNEVIRTLEKYLLRRADKFSHLYPLSILPIIHYIIAKKIEVDNLRIIARGKESKLSEDMIKNLLVI